MADPTAKPRRGRLRRWLILTVLIPVVLVLAAFLALPWWLGSPGGRTWLLARANRAMAPGRLEIRSFAWSWFGPTRMTGFVIRDPQGEVVVEAEHAVWDRNLWQALFDKPRYGTLRLERASLDVKRLPDGTIDLVEAIKPILRRDPATEFQLRASGRLRLRCPELAEPLTGRLAELVIDRPADPKRLTWNLTLEEAAAGPDKPGRLLCKGSIDKDRGSADERNVLVGLTVQRWPVAARLAGDAATLHGRLSGQATVERKEIRWQTTGQARLEQGRLSGPSFGGENIDPGPITLDWRAGQTKSGWQIVAATAESPVGEIHARGVFPPVNGSESLVEANIDLAALSKRLPNERFLHPEVELTEGRLTGRLTAEFGADGSDRAWNLRADLTRLVASRGERRLVLDAPAHVELALVERAGGIALEQFDVASAFLVGTGRGDFDSGITLAGELDWDAWHRQFRELVELDEFQPRGTTRFTANYRRDPQGYTGSLEFDLDSRKTTPHQVPDWHLQATLSGPATSVGWPSGWARLTADLKGPEFAAALSVEAVDNQPTGISLTAHAPLDVNARTRAEARAYARRDGDVWKIDDAQLDLVAKANSPESNSPKEARLSLHAHGEFDPDAAMLRLVPAGPDRAAGLSLVNEGIHGRNVGRAGWALESRWRADAAAVDQWLAVAQGGSPVGLTGRLDLRADAKDTGEGLAGLLNIESDNLAIRRGDDAASVLALGPVAVSVAADHRPDAGSLEVRELLVRSDLASARGSGHVDELLGQHAVFIEGTIEPNWERLQAWLTDEIDPAARLAGGPGRFSVHGPTAGPDARAFSADLKVSMQGLDVYGMRFGPAPIGVRWADEQLRIDPIETSLNGGRVILRPTIEHPEAGGPYVLSLASDSGVYDAEINDEVSHRVLAFVAPVLDRATRVNGRVSARFDRVAVPIVSDAAQAAEVEGTVVFQDVTFNPGPMAMQLYDVVGMDPMTLRLDQPVVLSIADGVVHQRGFSLPLGNIARVRMDGSVGFDRTLALNVSVPLAAERFADVPVFNRIAQELRLEVPIRGTLDDPKIDGEAMRQAMGRVGTEVAQSAGLGSLESLIQGLSTPRDPAEVARLQAERAERQRLRREQAERKREERRLKREARKRARAESDA